MATCPPIISRSSTTVVKAGADGIDGSGQPGRAGADDDEVLLDRLGGDLLGNIFRLFQRQKRFDEKFLGLKPDAGKDAVDERLGHGGGAQALGQIGILVDLDDLGGNEVGFDDGGGEGGERLLRAVGAGRA